MTVAAFKGKLLLRARLDDTVTFTARFCLVFKK